MGRSRSGLASPRPEAEGLQNEARVSTLGERLFLCQPSGSRISCWVFAMRASEASGRLRLMLPRARHGAEALALAGVLLIAMST